MKKPLLPTDPTFLKQEHPIRKLSFVMLAIVLSVSLVAAALYLLFSAYAAVL